MRQNAFPPFVEPNEVLVFFTHVFLFHHQSPAAERFALLAAGENQAQKRELLLAQKMPKNGVRTSRPVHALLGGFLEWLTGSLFGLV